MALNINGTTGISGVDGSASAPALQGSDSNTGVSFGTDTVNINTGGSTRATVDSNGRLGVGTTSPLSYAGATITNDNGLALQGSSQSRLLFRHDNGGTNNKLMDLAFDEGRIKIRQINDDTTTATELYRFRSDGQFCVGTTGNVTASTGGATFSPASDGRKKLMLGVTVASGRGLVNFFNSNGEVGGINTDGSGTQYLTSSDYRLKENVVPISDGIIRLKTLKPSRFNFKKDSDVTVDGFLAHEVTAVPEAITGTKDEVVTQQLIDRGDKEQSELGDPVYQSIDQSKLVPLLTAALQEAIAKIEVLETKVAALESA